MSKKAKPHSAPSSLRPKRRTLLQRAGSTRARLLASPERVPHSWAERAKLYLPHVAASSAILVFGTIALCFAVILLGGWRFAYLPAAIGHVWFVLHGVPIQVDGVALGAMPLLPVIITVALVAWRIRATTARRVSILDLLVIAGFTVAIPFTLSAIAQFMVTDAGVVFPVEAPPVGAALGWPVLVHLVGMCIGVRRVLWRGIADALALPVVAVEGARRAAVGCGWLLAGAMLVYVACLVAGAGRIREIFTLYPNLSWVGAVLLVLLSVCYLPNAVVATLVVLLGGSVEVAAGEISLFDALLVPFPPLPVFAAVPPAIPGWAPALLAVPAIALLLFYFRTPHTMIEVATAATWAAVYGLGVVALAGGIAGAYGFVGPHLWTSVLLLFCWFVIAGALVWAAKWLYGLVHQSKKSQGVDYTDET